MLIIYFDNLTDPILVMAFDSERCILYTLSRASTQELTRALHPRVSTMACSAPSASVRAERREMDVWTQKVGAPALAPLRLAQVRQQLFFPDRRLVQFDCGKLQALATLRGHAQEVCGPKWSPSGTQLAVKIALQQGLIKASEVTLLVQAPIDNSKENPVAAWLGDTNWQSCVALSLQHEEFANLPSDLEGSWKRWKEWCELEQPEGEALPQEWKRLSSFERLMVVRALRPDRMTLAVELWVREVLGGKYVESIPFDLAVSFEDAGPAVPIFFLLSPGVNPDADVKVLGNGLGKTEDEGKHVVTSIIYLGWSRRKSKARLALRACSSWEPRRKRID